VARLEQAEADLRNAEALVSGRHGAGQAVAQLQATRAEAASADADVAAAEATARQTEADYQRYRTLPATKVVSAQQLDAAQSPPDAAAADASGAESRGARRGGHRGGRSPARGGRGRSDLGVGCGAPRCRRAPGFGAG